MLLGVVPAGQHVFKAPLGGDGLGSLEPRAGIRDQADPGEDLIRLDDDVVAAVDPLDPRRTGSASEMTVTTGKDANQPTPGHRLDHVSRAGRERAPAPFASRTL